MTIRQLLITSSFLLLLAACAPKTTPAGGGAIPKEEPLSPSGNPSSYEIFGIEYRLLPTSKGYKEEGYASWYGKDFHGKRTSSGTPYNMHAYSAAHKTLPIPSYVKVTNLENGKSLILRVDDRGPFVKNRIIDLSYTAAKELDVLRHGTARVRVEAVAPYQSLNNEKRPPSITDIQMPQSKEEIAQVAPIAPAPTPQPTPIITPPATTPLSGNFALQLGSFSNESNARAYRNSLEASLNQPTEVLYHNGLHRVILGRYPTHQAAKEAGERLSHPNTILTF